MNLYHIQFVEFEDIAIFATNGDDAQRLVDKYLLIHLAAASNYLISHPIKWSHMTEVELHQLRAAFAKNVQGYGVYDSTNGWDVVPLSHTVLLPKIEHQLGQSVTMKIRRQTRVT